MKRNVLTQYLIITASCALYAVGFNWMFDPNHISVGGFTGLGQIINYLLPGLPIGTIVIILNVPLFVLGWRFIGKDFLFSSIYATAVSSLMIDVLSSIHTFSPMDPILACIYGGIVTGIGCGLLLHESATTGGTEMAARLLKLKFQGLSIGSLCLGLDVAVTIGYALCFRDMTRAMYGVVALYILSLLIDRVVYGPNASKVAYIIMRPSPRSCCSWTGASPCWTVRGPGAARKSGSSCAPSAGGTSSPSRSWCRASTRTPSSSCAMPMRCWARASANMTPRACNGGAAMKKTLLAALLAALMLVCTGCASFLERDYSVVQPHSSTYYESEDRSVLRAESYQDLVNDLMLLLTGGAREGTIWLYAGTEPLDASAAAERACKEVQQETPLGAYAVKYLTYTIDDSARNYTAIHLTIGYRRTQEQIASMVYTTSVSALGELLTAAARRGSGELVVQVGYFDNQEEEVRSIVDQVQAMEAPEQKEPWTVNFYPEGGDVGIIEILLKKS